MTEPASLDGARVILDATSVGPEAFELAGGEAVVVSERCPGEDRTNEDAAALVAIDPETAVIAIADGAGGAPLGGTAARLAIEALTASLLTGGAATPRERILDGFEQANQCVLALGVGAATTLAIAEIGPGWLRAYHAGDSAIAVTGQRGKIKLVTLMHSPTGYAMEAGLLNESEALRHEDRNVVSNLVGNANMRVEMGSPRKLSQFDTVVLGTDGLFDNLELPEVIECVRSGPLRSAASALLEACRNRMTGDSQAHPSKPDDLTFVLFRAGPFKSRAR
jgi:serine/threonine protein phosphatase PrpC